SPSDAELALFGGILANRMGRFEVAIERLGRCVKLDPARARAHAALAYALEQGGRLDEAIASYAAAARADPQFAGRVDLGGALRQLGCNAVAVRRWPEAAAAFERAMAVDPGHADDRVNLAIALQQSGRNDAALREMEVARKDISLGPDARARLGALYGEEGDRARARQLMDQAILQNP